MPFSSEVKTQAMIACGRKCCICHKFCGNKMEVHHIKAQSDGGSDRLDNAIPLCFDCHAEVRQYDSRHPKGIKFTEKELISHRDSWYRVVADGGESSQHHDPIEIKVKCLEKERLKFLQRINTGKEMLSFVCGVSAVEYSYDELNDASEAEYIANTIQQIQDLMDINDAFEPADHVKVAFELNSTLQELEKQGFWIYMGIEKRILTGGVKKEPENFPVLCLNIKRISLIKEMN